MLAGRDGFSYGIRRMAQRTLSSAKVCSAGLRLIEGLLLLAFAMSALRAAEAPRAQHELINPQGEVEVLRKGANAWAAAKTRPRGAGMRTATTACPGEARPGRYSPAPCAERNWLRSFHLRLVSIAPADSHR